MKINENFKEMGIARIDTKNRVTLGALLRKFKILLGIPINDFETFIGDKGDILLRPRTAIPTRELWIHENSEIKKDILEGIKDVEQGRSTKVNDVGKFLDKL